MSAEAPAAGLLGTLSRWSRPAVFLGHNGVTLTGAVLTTSSAITLILFWLREAFSATPSHSYGDLVFVLALPGLFVFGLLLMPAGVLWRRSSLRRRGELPDVYPQVDLNLPVVRNAFALVAVATTANVAILGTAAYKGVEHMDSTSFCGLTCHTVMAPQHTAYADGAHSRVACVECHIGEGATWFVKSKLSGTRQLFAVALETYSRPIPTPVTHLRPARETCEQCHWPQKFVGDKFLVRTKYADDEANSATSTVLVLKVGGRAAGKHAGIHGVHLDPERPIDYVSIDGRRQVIPVVETVDAAGKPVRYVSEDVKATPDQIAKGERRRMDCMDCHNRPAHTFEMPERALDHAFADGRLSSALPSLKKVASSALRAEYADRETAARKIAETIGGFYRQQHPTVWREHGARVETAVREVQKIWARNVFPNMRVGWGTYPNNVGHEDFPGCFRCHDESHKRADGVAITQDCTACHTILAQDESDPKVLSDLGLR